VDLSPRKRQVTTADNVIIVAMDTTGSMGSWREEIFKRLALLFKEAQGFVGESLEVLFMGFGDIPLGDPFEVCPTGDGPILDTYIEALTHQTGGGGNKIESADLPAVYVHSLLDTSCAKSVYFFTITDEGFYDPPGRANTVTDLSPELNSMKSIYSALKSRMGVFTILAETRCYGTKDDDVIRYQWEDALGKEYVVPLDDSRRIVDVMLGVIAKTTGQIDKFSQALLSRQAGTHYGKINVGTVNKSLFMVPGGPSVPVVTAGTKSLLDPSLRADRSLSVPKGSRVSGTKSLLDLDD